jgi:hypothetical protein
VVGYEHGWVGARDVIGGDYSGDMPFYLNDYIFNLLTIPSQFSTDYLISCKITDGRLLLQSGVLF